MPAKNQTKAVQRKQAVDITQALIIKSKDGKEARQIKMPVVLSVKDKTITDTRSAIGRIVSADGHIQLAADCGLLTDVESFSQKEDNVQVFYADAWCAGYTRLGQLYRTKASVRFDLKAYFLQDLIAKQQFHPSAFKLLPSDGPKPGDGWASFVLNPSITVWVDLSYKDAWKWVKDEQQQKKFGDRKAQKMALRNAIKAHPAFPRIGKIETDTLVVDCTAWYTKDGPLRIDGSTLRLDMSKQLAATDPNIETETVKTIDIVADKEEMLVAQSENEVIEAIDAPPEDDQAPATEENEDQEKLDALIGNIVKLKKSEPLKFNGECRKLEIDAALWQEAPLEDLLALQEAMTPKKKEKK